MFSDLTKASYKIIYVLPLWICMGLLSMHRPILYYLIHLIYLSKHLSAPSIYPCKVYNTAFC